MKRLLYAFFFLNSVIFTQQALAAGMGNHFMGLWKGIDAGDGSVTTLSISDTNNDGTMTVRLTDTFFAKCKAAGYETSPGLVDGTATIQNMTLMWNYSFKCWNAATSQLVEIKKDTMKFEFNAKEDVLIDQEGEIFHHISHQH
ncbi:MAG: hypothetical protein ACXVCP_11180 [Bdellovibrio sp.]